MYHSFLIHSSADGHLGCFHVLSIVIVLQWTLGYMCLFQFRFPQCVCPGVGLLGHMGVVFPVFKGISTLFSIVAVLVCIPTNGIRGFSFSSDLLIQNYSGYFSFFVYVYIYLSIYLSRESSHVALVVKNLPASAGDIRMLVQSLGRGNPL